MGGSDSRDVLVFADPTPPREDLVLQVASLLSEEQRLEGEPEEVGIEGAMLFTSASVRTA